MNGPGKRKNRGKWHHISCLPVTVQFQKSSFLFLTADRKFSAAMSGRKTIMGKTLYLECNTGISGDMFAAAMLDLGADEDTLLKALHSLPLDGYSIKISRVTKAGLSVKDFDVVLEDEIDNHDHDMEYLYGHLKENEGSHDHHNHEGHHHDHGKTGEESHDHDHKGEHASHHSQDEETHEYAHSHDHDHKKEHSHEMASGHEHAHTHAHGHHHVHRGLKEVLDIIHQGELTEGAMTLAEKIFTILGEAEAKAHGMTLDTVHFHEVGAVDSIVDIVSAAVCYDNLDIDQVIIPYLGEGHGTVRCAHGVLPIPVPATTNIVASYGIPLRPIDEMGEFITPTGAAIAAALMTTTKLPDTYTIDAFGMGAGKREYQHASILRAFLLADDAKKKTNQIMTGF